MLNETIKLILQEFFDQKINCIGLITAQNPQEQQQDSKYNESANDKLLADLQGMGYEPFPTFYYGESGFLVPNISKSSLIGLGKKYNQRAVIWGQKVPEDRNGLSFEWNYLEDGKIRNQKTSGHPFVVPEFS